MQVFLNDRFIPAEEAAINIYDLGVVLGATVTEMVRTFHQRPYRLEDHVGRIMRSVRYVRFDLDMAPEHLEDVCRELVSRNSAELGPGGELGLVVFITAGENRVYAGGAAGDIRTKPTVCVHTFPLPFPLWAKGMREGAHVVTPSIRHVPPQCYDPKVKYRSRMHYYLAEKEARLADPGAVPLLLDLDGNVTETSGSNFLVVRNGTIVSPTLRNILPGISRAVVIELAKKLRIPFVERDFQVYDVINADEAFQTTTPYCIMPVTRINGLSIGDGEPGPIFRQLIGAWSDEVGLDIERQILSG